MCNEDPAKINVLTVDAASQMSAFSSYFRMKDVKSYHGTVDGVILAMKAYPNVDFRYFI